MQVLIVLVCCLSGLARASLEPAGYRPPGSDPHSSYLPPASSHSAPDNRYVPSAVGSVGHPATFNSQVSRGFSLPTKNTAAPFAQYLPANRQPSHPGVSANRGNNFAQNSSPARQYIPANVNQRSYTPSLPVNDYLPPRHQAQSVVSAPSNSYLTPNVHSAPSNAYLTPNNPPTGPSNAYLTPNVQSTHSSGGYSGQSEFGQSSSGHHSGSVSVNRHSKIDEQGNSGHYSAGQTRQSGSAGYRYNAPENQVPAKYDFDYNVKDNYGNDYGHRESRSGENTQGVYMVVLPDGRRQTVHYEADSHGYRPSITYEQTGSQTAYNNGQGYHY